MMRHHILSEGEKDGGSGGGSPNPTETTTDGPPADTVGEQQQLPGTPSPADVALSTAQSDNADLRKQLAKIQADQSKSEETALTEQGKHQELATKAVTERDTALAALSFERMTNALLAAASSAGLQSPDFLALVSRSGMEIVDGKVVGAEKAIEDLKTKHASLFGEAKTHTTHTPDGAPAGDNGAGGFDPSKTYTKEQVEKMGKEDFKKYFDHLTGNKSQHSI